MSFERFVVLTVFAGHLSRWGVSSGLRNGLNGVHFNVSAHDFPPFQYLQRKQDGSIIYFGSTPHIIYWIAEKFNMSFTLVPSDDTEIARYGTIQAGLNQIINKKVDISTLCIVPTYERSKLMSFSYPVAIESYRLMVPKPEEESRLFGPVRPFHFSVWIFFVLSAISVIFALSFNRIVYLSLDRYSDQPPKFMLFIKYLNDYALYMISIFTNHGDNIKTKRLTFRIALSLWLLASTVLVNLYSGTLMSSLTVPKLKPAINSLEALVESKDLVLISSANSVMSQTILNGTTKTFKAIAQSVRKRPDSIYRTQEEGLEKIFSMRYAYPLAESYKRYILDVDLKRSGQCRFHLSGRIPITQPYTFALEKGSKFNEYFSEKVQYLWEIGLMEYWLQQNLPRVDKCLVKHKDYASHDPIKLVDLTSAFFVLGIGMLLSLISFLFEIIEFKFRHKNQKRRRRTFNY